MASSGDDDGKVRVFFIPFFASGHMIPMTDLACIFGGHPAVQPTLVITPANSAFLRPTLDRHADAGRLVETLQYPFPDVGLPPGVENLATAPAPEAWRIYKAVELARVAHDEILRRHRPDAVVADIPFWWTTAIASDLGIPRITFHAVGVFPQLAMNNLFKIHQQIGKLEAHCPVEVPDFPGPRIEIPRSELPAFLQDISEDFMIEEWDRMKESQLAAHGVVVNTFYELEAEYCDLHRRVDAKQAWYVGPLALASGAVVGGADGPIPASVLKWLDEKEKGSVVFVCFGSWCHFSTVQLQELATGLATSGRHFLWVVRGSDGADNGAGACEGWMPEEWEERVAGRGMVIRGWAPQVAILGHPAVGAFLSHCGWNSVLEAVTAGVPLLTWPLVFEQFINERLVTEVVGTGRRVCDGPRSTDEAAKLVVPAEAIARAVSQFMEGGNEGKEVRRRATELAAKARAAVGQGGSSRRDLDGLIDELLTTSRTRRQGRGRGDSSGGCASGVLYESSMSA